MPDHPARELAQLRAALDRLDAAIRAPAPEGPPSIAPGSIVQLAPHALPPYGGYLMHCALVYPERVRGVLLTMHRDIWHSVPIDLVTPIGRLVHPKPPRGFRADPALSDMLQEAANAAYRQRCLDIAAKRRETLAQTRRVKL